MKILFLTGFVTLLTSLTDIDGSVILSTNGFTEESALSTDTIITVKNGAILKVGITNVFCGASIISAEPGEIKSAGFCYSTRNNPTLNDYRSACSSDADNFHCLIENLVPATLYFLKAYCITNTDTIYSDQKIFYTHRSDAVADIDGNYYNPIVIGQQTWLAEDLKTTRYNDFEPIPQVRDHKVWGLLETPAFCWFGNDSVRYSFPRGKIYNWYAVNTGKLCPAGWHVPSDDEWTRLQNFLGGDSVAGKKMKTTSIMFWRSPNYEATNESGFSAIPGGYRNLSGEFFYATIFDKWWSSESVSPLGATSWYVYHATAYLYNQESNKSFGFSVRCIKDQ